MVVGSGPDGRAASVEWPDPERDVTMSTMARFLTVADAYPGYCQICHEPRVVGRITVTGWPHSGLACSRCLSHLAEEVQRRGSALPDGASQAASLTASAGGNGHLR
jgi:hypothetical protein